MSARHRKGRPLTFGHNDGGVMAVTRLTLGTTRQDWGQVILLSQWAQDLGTGSSREKVPLRRSGLIHPKLLMRPLKTSVITLTSSRIVVL